MDVGFVRSGTSTIKSVPQDRAEEGERKVVDATIAPSLTLLVWGFSAFDRRSSFTECTSFCNRKDPTDMVSVSPGSLQTMYFFLVVEWSRRSLHDKTQNTRLFHFENVVKNTVFIRRATSKC